MPHLNRSCTVRLAAINAAMAGCRPDYFPVVLAAWESLRAEGYAGKGIWQSTTGTAPLLVVNGPVRERIGPLTTSRGAVAVVRRRVPLPPYPDAPTDSPAASTTGK